MRADPSCQPSDSLEGAAVVIPAFQAGDALPQLVAELSRAGFGAIVIVDDGSGARERTFLEAVRSVPSVHVLTHTLNRGKGSALRTGFAYVVRSLPQAAVVVTADADGQHRAEDIVRVARKALSLPGRPVLGVRSFGGDVPLRSRAGNEITRAFFRGLTGMRLRDTQTGLRAVPCTFVEDLLRLPGDRYEYEMAMLAYLCREHGRPEEVEIATVYIDGNRSSSFRPLRDSLRIYGVLARLLLSGRTPRAGRAETSGGDGSAHEEARDRPASG
jgi:glycosyltransferase involved in cell wall biosynthesis